MKTIFILMVACCISQASRSQLYISQDANLRLAGNAQITLQDIDLVNDGKISAPANGRVIFNGSANNEISGAAQPAFAEMEIAKTGSGLLTLQTDINVTGKVIFTSNLIELNNHNIDLGYSRHAQR